MKLARRHHLEQLQLMADIGDQWVGPRGKKAYIFTQWNGRQLYPSSPLTAFRKVLTRHNAAHPDRPLPMITLHGLRHTSATLLISQSLDVRSVSARLGHAQTSTTLNIYAHAIKSKDQQAADILGGYLHAVTSNME